MEIKRKRRDSYAMKYEELPSALYLGIASLLVIWGLGILKGANAFTQHLSTWSDNFLRLLVFACAVSDGQRTPLGGASGNQAPLHSCL